MITRRSIKFNLQQIIAITEKNVRMALRYKINLISGYVLPLIQLVFPLIIMGRFFTFQENFGPWNAENYIIYLLIGYTILLTQRIISTISGELRSEKFTLTLQALIMAPLNKINLLIGYILSHFIQILVPFAVLLIACYILYPISIISLMIVIILMFSLLLIFSGIGFIIAIFQISNENIARILTIFLTFVFSFSCNTYPYQIFPDYIQFFINLNPIYYIIDIVRLVWIEDDIQYTFLTHFGHFIIFFSLIIIFPTMGILTFNIIYKKYGIRGY